MGLLSSFIIFPDQASQYLLTWDTFRICYLFMAFLGWGIFVLTSLQDSIPTRSFFHRLDWSTEYFFVRQRVILFESRGVNVEIDLEG